MVKANSRLLSHDSQPAVNPKVHAGCWGRWPLVASTVISAPHALVSAGTLSFRLQSCHFKIRQSATQTHVIGCDSFQLLARLFVAESCSVIFTLNFIP